MIWVGVSADLHHMRRSVIDLDIDLAADWDFEAPFGVWR
jgi:hypothetical protein